MSHKYPASASTYYNAQYLSIPNKEDDGGKMHGSRRVITFCFLTTILPTLLIVVPLYLRNIKYADVMYKISDSDVIQIHRGQSSIFCEKHFLKMNTSFNAFQMKGTPQLSDQRKHIKLKKSMTLPDDTLEYWGFYLFKGATVELKACSRYDGSKILVVKGDKILNTCNILDSNKNRKDNVLTENQGHVHVTLENPHGKKRTTSSTEQEVEKPTEDDENIEDIFDIGKKWSQNQSDTNKDKQEDLRKNSILHSNKLRLNKRDTNIPPLHNPNTILDTGVNHGGNAFDDKAEAQESAVSSFEISLHECYNKDILMNEFFPFSIQCNNTNYLESTTTLKVVHEILQDGYYYYIFYSDNDYVRNDIHAIFDIYKPTFQYVNMLDSKICINRTECEFGVTFFSDELVIVEAPTKDGLNNEYESAILTSVCKPRVAVYVCFPVAVLLLILLFAFL